MQLAEFDRRRLWVEVGYSSLFDFLHRELGLSKGAAFYRKAAVDLIRRFPEVVEPLRDGRLCLMSAAEVPRVLTAENRRDVLPRFFHLSKREAQALAAALLPQNAPPLREVVTTVRVPAVEPALALTTPAGPATELAVSVAQPVELAARSSAAGPVESHAAARVARPSEQPVSAPVSPRLPSTTTEPLTAD